MGYVEFPQMSSNGRIGPRMLHVEAGTSITRHDQVERFVEPTIVAFAVQNCFGECVQFRMVILDEKRVKQVVE